MMQPADEQNAHFASVVQYPDLSRPSGKVYCVKAALPDISVYVVTRLIPGKETLSTTPHGSQIDSMLRPSAVCTNRRGRSDIRCHAPDISSKLVRAFTHLTCYWCSLRAAGAPAAPRFQIWPPVTGDTTLRCTLELQLAAAVSVGSAAL